MGPWVGSTPWASVYVSGSPFYLPSPSIPSVFAATSSAVVVYVLSVKAFFRLRAFCGLLGRQRSSRCLIGRSLAARSLRS